MSDKMKVHQTPHFKTTGYLMKLIGNKLKTGKTCNAVTYKVVNLCNLLPQLTTGSRDCKGVQKCIKQTQRTEFVINKRIGHGSTTVKSLP